MRAVIPVAGFGTRLKPHTYSLPKVLLNVGGKPILSHILSTLVKHNITSATFIIGYLGEQIKEFVSKEYPEIKADFVKQEEMLGLGHAIYTAIPTFNNEEIFIILGDTVFDLDLEAFLENKSESILGVKEVAEPKRFGVVLLKEDGTIKKLIEKPQDPISNLALVGLYYVPNSKVLANSLTELIEKNIRSKGEFQLTDALQLMIDKGEKMRTFPIEGWYDCGKPETLLSTNQFILGKNHYNCQREGVVTIPPVYIAPNAKVRNSVIGPNTTIAEDCEILNSHVKNSIISSGAKVEKTMLENSIIGNNAIVKGNFKRLNAGDSAEIELY